MKKERELRSMRLHYPIDITLLIQYFACMESHIFITHHLDYYITIYKMPANVDIICKVALEKLEVPPLARMY